MTFTDIDNGAPGDLGSWFPLSSHSAKLLAENFSTSMDSNGVWFMVKISHITVPKDQTSVFWEKSFYSTASEGIHKAGKVIFKFGGKLRNDPNLILSSRYLTSSRMLITTTGPIFPQKAIVRKCICGIVHVNI